MWPSPLSRSRTFHHPRGDLDTLVRVSPLPFPQSWALGSSSTTSYCGSSWRDAKPCSPGLRPEAWEIVPPRFPPKRGMEGLAWSLVRLYFLPESLRGKTMRCELEVEGGLKKWVSLGGKEGRPVGLREVWARDLVGFQARDRWGAACEPRAYLEVPPRSACPKSADLSVDHQP